MIDFQNVSFSHSGSNGDTILDSINLTIRDGEWVAVTGGNGSGKSTLCRLIAGLYEPTAGSVRVDGAHIYGSRATGTSVAIAFQNPDSQFLTSTVKREILFGMENVGFDAKTMSKRLRAAMEMFGLGALLQRNPHTLSGGEKQRVMLASIWVMQPRHIILDEPFSFLDSRGRRAFLEAVRDRFHREGLTIVWSTLQPDEIAYADRIIYLDKGCVACDGSPEQLASIIADGVLTESLSPYLLERVNGQREGKEPAGNSSTGIAPSGNAYEGHLSAGHALDGNAHEVHLSAGHALDGNAHEVHLSAGHTPAGNAPAGPAPMGNAPAESAPILVTVTDALFSPEEGDFELTIPSLRVWSGETVGITGPSGSGKTTLLLGCSGILPPRRGELIIFDKAIRSANDRPSGKIAFLFQTPEEGFFSPTVHDEVAFGYRRFHGADGVTKAVTGALEAVGLDAEVFMQRSPFRLSQGEKRMVAIASLLVLPAELYYLDEPTLFLDGKARSMLAAALARLKSRGLTALIASHESRFIRSATERQISLEL